jgi:hypothetical protein
MRGYRRNLGSEILQFHRERFSAARSVWTPPYRATPPGEPGSKRIAECIFENYARADCICHFEPASAKTTSLCHQGLSPAISF